MTIITAPDGAIFALLAIASAAPIVPDENAELWLREQHLIEDTPGGVTALTSRGAAFLRILSATPLPVKVERWDDPRDQAPEPSAAKTDVDRLLEGLAGLLVQRPAAPPTSAAPRPAPAGAKPLDFASSIPAGYTPIPTEWTTVPPGQTPPGLRPDINVRVMYRDGRVSAPRAAQAIIWFHKDHPDDVIAYKVLGGDTMSGPVVIR